MTDRVHSLIVVLKEDVRVDDVEHLAAAIRMFSQVLSVDPVVADHHSWMAEQRASRKWYLKIRELLDEEEKGG